MLETPAPPAQTTEPDGSGLSPRMRAWTLVVACLGISLVMSSMVALNTALPDIARATSASQTQLTWIVDAYTLTLACLLLPAGAIGDRYGRRGALVFGLVVFTVGSLIPVAVATPFALTAARALTGVGAAFIMPATLSLLTASYPERERAKPVAIWAGVAGSGAVVGMLGTGVLLHFWSWTAIFWAFSVSAVALIPLSLTIPSSREDELVPIDWLGAATIGGGVAVFVFGMLEAPARGWSHPLVVGALIAGLVLAGLFAVIERRRTHPLLDVRLFGDPTFATGAATTTVLFVAMFGFFFLTMQYIQLVMGYDPLRTALAISPLTGPMLLLSGLSVWYLPKLGLRVVVILGLLLVAAGFVALQQLEIGSPYWDLAWPLLILSSGVGLCTAPSTAAIMGSVPDDKQGVASAVNDVTREIGAALGIALTGSMLASRYTAALAPGLAAYPEPARSAAGRSLAEALEVAARLGPQGRHLADTATSAFLGAVHGSFVVLAILTAISAALIGLRAPGRDGRQLPAVRRIRSAGRRRQAGLVAFLVREG